MGFLTPVCGTKALSTLFKHLRSKFVIQRKD